MAAVYLAWDERLQTRRALKLLKPELAGSPGLRARFEAEARTMVELRHPNILVVHDIDAEVSGGEERVFIVMDRAAGSLEDRVRTRGPLAPADAAALGDRLLAALAVAHGAGVIHRDVKPRNVLLSDAGEPLLADFGIARVAAEGGHTRTGQVVGTPAYMAPEQRRDPRAVDERADLYGVGATLYAAITGQPPADLHVGEAWEGGVALPEPLAAVIRSATRYRPEDRYRDAEGMRAALAAAAAALAAAGPTLAPSVGSSAVRSVGLGEGRLGDTAAATDDSDTWQEPAASRGEIPASTTASTPEKRGAGLLGAALLGGALLAGGWLASGSGASIGVGERPPAAPAPAAVSGGAGLQGREGGGIDPAEAVEPAGTSSEGGASAAGGARPAGELESAAPALGAERAPTYPDRPSPAATGSGAEALEGAPGAPVEAAPAVAAEPGDEAALARVALTGGAAAAWLVDGPALPAQVAPGSYSVMARFERAGGPVEVGPFAISLEAGQEKTVHCDEGFTLCEVVP